jgi:uncharacterized protein involved in outer membrane biogenesis
MKRLIIILAVVAAVILVAAVIIPMVFEEDIKEMVAEAIDDNIEADVQFDPAKFKLSLLSNFPNPTASIGDFGIFGTGLFEGDTLLMAEKLSITIDLFSLFGDEYGIKSISVDKPTINLIILETGEANYDIVAGSEEPEDASQQSEVSYRIAIDHWSVNDGRFRYFDQGLGMELVLDGIEHSGGGNITLDEYDLSTQTNAARAYITYDGIQYLSGQAVDADATIHINMPAFKFTFLENQLKINDFPVSFDGWLAMTDEDIDMDIAFASPNGSIKSLYSLIPGAFTAEYEGVKAAGDLSFEGYVKGIYNDQSMPAYKVQLKATDGMISYPDLPTSINNLDIDMLIACVDGVVENTSIDISKFQMRLGNNPIEGMLAVANLRDFDMKADVRATMNLAELSTIFAMEGTELRGMMNMSFLASGRYDTINNIIPAISGTMMLEKGYVKSTEFAKALENISFKSSIDGSNGRMKDIVVKVEDFTMEMGGEALKAQLVLRDMLDYKWDLQAGGKLDLEVLSEVYPVDGMHYAGYLQADVKSKGTYSDVTAERYDRLSTSGRASLTDFVFNSPDLPQGMTISQSVVSMNQQRIAIEQLEGTIGKSDMNLKGWISNYIDYFLTDEATLKGKMSLNSNLMDLNEWMTDESVEEDTTSSPEAPVIPKNIDFEFSSSIDRLLYNNLQLQDLRGVLIAKNGMLDMKNLGFKLLDGSVVMNGSYDTRDSNKPAFNYQLDVQNLSIPQAYSSFSTVQVFAPMAKMMNGDFSTNFSVSGDLTNSLTPVYQSMQGSGLIKIAEASMKESRLVSGVLGFMKTDVQSSQLSLKDVIMRANIKNGRAHVSPFKAQLGQNTADISGSIGIDGSLDYQVATEVDAGIVGQQVNQLLAQFDSNARPASSKVKLQFQVGGTYEKPQVNLMGTSSAKGQVEEQLKDEAQKQVEKAQTEIEEKVKDEGEKLLEEGEKQIEQQLDSAKKEVLRNLEDEAGDVLNEELDSAANNLKESLKDLFKRKKKN